MHIFCEETLILHDLMLTCAGHGAKRTGKASPLVVSLLSSVERE